MIEGFARRSGWRQAAEGETAPSMAAWAPVDYVDFVLADVWELVLGTPPSNGTEDFFDMGGNSARLLMLLWQVQQRFGLEVPVESFLVASTFVGLSLAVRQGSRLGADKHLIEIEAGRSGFPLFCVHPAPGDVSFMTRLVRSADFGRPVYGLRAISMADHIEAPLTRVEDLAECYLQDIEAVQPTGPYFLVGACTGGAVAFEIAQRLVEKGETVTFLALLDAPIYDWHSPQANRRNLNGDARAIWTRCFREVSAGRGEQGEEPVRALSWIERLADVYAANVIATYRYRPRTYAGSPVVFIRAALEPEDYASEWAKFTACGMELHAVPADHIGVAENAITARLLADRLAEFDDQR